MHFFLSSDITALATSTWGGLDFVGAVVPETPAAARPPRTGTQQWVEQALWRPQVRRRLPSVRGRGSEDVDYGEQRRADLYDTTERTLSRGRLKRRKRIL